MGLFHHIETIMVSLSLAAGAMAAVWMLREDLRRRHITANAYLVVAIASIAALVAFLAASGIGLASCGALLGWSLAIAFQAPSEKVAPLEFLDAGSPAAAAAIATLDLGFFVIVARIQDNAPDKIMPIMPLYEFLAWAGIAAFLWSLGTRASLGPRPKGETFAVFLMLYGLTHFIVQFLTSASPVLVGLSLAQFAGIATFLTGGVLLWWILARFHNVAREHRILQHVAERGDVMQQEYSRATPECPHPERWRMYDAMAAEVEVLDFLKTLVTTIKPELVVETGTFLGSSTLRIAEGLKENGFGRVISCEADPKVFEEARKKIVASGLAEWIELRNESSLEMKVEGRIDLLYCDSDLPMREQEVRRFLPKMNPDGLILMHDASSALKTVREGARNLEREGLLSVVFLPTPRGLVVAQKREGRT
jgi:predicted O-methyltransferase YrrM